MDTIAAILKPQMKHIKRVKQATDNDFDPICGRDLTLIPEAEYQATCINVNRAPYQDEYRLYLTFKITSYGEHLGKEIVKNYRIPKDKKIAPSSNYYKDWVKVNGGNKPSRNAKMSPKIFLNKIFLISTRTVTHDYSGNALAADTQYSVVNKILEVLVN